MATETGSELVLAAHLPLLRIEEETVPFVGGDLWRMPWETFDTLTLGAFSDHRAAYEAVAPVFFRVTIRPQQMENLRPIEPTPGRTESTQLKMPSDRWFRLGELGLDIVARFHEALVDHVWHALLLEAPTAGFPAPRMSATFAVADEGWGIDVGGQARRLASVQGDADMEYLLTPSFVAGALGHEVLHRAEVHTHALATGAASPALQAAVQGLALCSSPLLELSDQCTIATMSLEQLLLPEVRSGLSSRLALRLGTALGRNRAERDQFGALGKALYDARSASVHGEAAPRNAEALITHHVAERLLAQVALELDARCAATGKSVDEIVTALDDAEPVAPVLNSRVLADAPLVPRTRPPLQNDRTSTVAMGGTNLESPEGMFMMWAPLVGLRTRGPLTFDPMTRIMVLPLSGHELLQLEERDIARDFAGRMRTLPEEIAALAIVEPAVAGMNEQAAREKLERRRALAVVAMRLAGLHHFVDPSLAGSVVVQGPMRFRFPSALRQSVWQMLEPLDEQPMLAETVVDHIREPWALMIEYEASSRHPDLERALSLFARTFDGRFASRDSTASLQFALLEALLGRFRAPDAPVPQLEALVAAVVGTEGGAARHAAAWFAEHGRQARNDVAHGRGSTAVTDDGAQALRTILCAALPAAIRVWLDAGDPVERMRRRPGRLLIDALTSRIQGTTPPSPRE